MRGLGLVALTASSVAFVPPAAHAAPSAPPPRSAPAATVTLITGDTVTVGADGGVQVRDRAGQPAGYLSNVKDGDTYVYPHGAFRHLASGLLDEDLFNVTELVADGYDDAHSAGIPLIVTYADPAATMRTAALPGTTAVRPLDSIGGAALTADRSGRFLDSATGARSASAVTKIWLDGKAEAALADSTAQIGAPEVWQRGNTGTGVDVAVLDTGIDTEHPDLAGAVAATASFVPGESVEDGMGHGTHVASTIAGSGAASGGKERGVAPGARLHVGKVLDNGGTGQESWIISGMEWAVREQRARIVSMSLGGDPTDGTDPMSVAVNQLSAETGALFVIAAGNAGPRPSTVGTPGAADAALTVGAVDGNDLLADFSSQGPRAGDRALKPDLTAPGVNILAARSRLSETGEGSYLSMSGTSMATPHVAGAAALVAAAHPELKGQQLKDALVSTTKGTPDLTAYQGGTGRLDAAASVSATVFATGSVNFGYPSYPAPAGPVDREITYTNIGATPVTLELASSLDLVTLSATRVTVPARGTASVTVTTSFDRVPAEQTFAGYVTATGGLRTSVGGGKEGARHQLALRGRDRSGKPLGGVVVVLSRNRTVIQMIDETGALDLRLPEGTYTAYLTGDVEGVHGPSSMGLAVLPVTGIALNGDRTVVFDAAKARRLTATTPQPSTVVASRFTLVRDITGGNPWLDAWYPGPQYDSVWVLPTGKVPDGTLTASARWRLAQPELTVAGYDDLRVRHGATPLPSTVRSLDAVLGGAVRGKALVVRAGGETSIEERAAAAAAAAAAGAKLLLVVNDGPGRLEPWPGSVWMPTDPPPVTVATLTRDEGEKLIARIQRERGVRLDVTSHPVPEYAYDLVTDYVGAVPADLTYRATSGNLARVDMSFDNWRPGRAIEQRSEIDSLGLAMFLDYAEAPARGDRTDWVTAGRKWISNVVIPGEQAQHTAPTAYRAGSVNRQRWFGPVQRPRLVDEPDGLNIFRQEGGWFFANIPGWGDSGAAHAGHTGENPGADNRLSLYQGDKLVSTTDRYDPLLVAGPLPAPALPYRLVSENNRDAWAGPYSTSTRTEWSFTSGDVQPGTVVSPPLIQLDYDVDTDRDGRARRTFDLTIATSTLATATDPGTVRTVTLDVSYDDGATWHRVTLRRQPNGWSTRIAAPRTARFVTVRTSARDTRGNTVEQLITRAFGLR
ncbi:subtilisin family serine protease [Catenuloplanes indicus]|uniref:Subtilisin family serine protease n=1 Tax=Catenuloplanes indicus TaxID=137267 RepID=A0AAE4AVQ9_9ACTN|nr:subtilisin family serine protease [Catenuloplanes indicus]